MATEVIRNIHSDTIRKCYNCSRSFECNPIRFPTNYNDKNRLYTFNELPHCRISCALRTVLDYGYNSYQYKMLFHYLYGFDVVSAPPRSLLFIENDMTIEKYHEIIDSHVIVEEVKLDTKSFIAPINYNITEYVNNILSKKAMEDIDSTVMNVESEKRKTIRKLCATQNNKNLQKKLKTFNL